MAMNPFLKYSMMGLGPLSAGAAAAPKGFFGNMLFGKEGGVQQTPLYNQQQQGAMSSLLNQGMQNSNFEPIEQRARSQFFGNTIPTLSERFTGMGGQGGQRSSAFMGSLGGAGAGLEEALSALRSQHGMQQLGMGLHPQFENTYMAGQQGMLSQGMSSLMSMLPLLMMM